MVKPTVVKAPFTVLIDSREQRPYEFLGLHTNADQGSALIEVPIMRTALLSGDYGLLGYPRVCVERKSKEDLYSSIGQRRKNFDGRLQRMDEEKDYAAVVVEAEFHDVIKNPPVFSQLKPKTLGRTILAWAQRYPVVHWWFLPGRDAAEAWTFRILERYFLDHHDASGVIRA